MLFDYIDGTLREEDVIAFEEHYKNCEACKETINTFKLMETVGEYNYDVPIDVVKAVKDSTDDELYSSKKHLFINKYLTIKNNYRKYAAVAAIALVLTGGILINNNYNFIGNFSKFMTSSNSIDKETKDFSSTFGLPEYITIYNKGSQSKLVKGSEKYNKIIEILDENLKKEKAVGLVQSKIMDNSDEIKQKEISLEFIYFELSRYPLDAKNENNKKPFTKLLWSLTGENVNIFELGLNSGIQEYGRGAVGGFSKDISTKVLEVIK
jgi:dsDNA-specific endonuclease/ATPase MutS2